MPTLSAVIITHNEAAQIAGCLESLAIAPDLFVEVVVVDDASSDETAAIARRYTTRVLVHRHIGENWDLNKNIGMDAASGDWVFLIDADERLTPALATALVELLREEPAHAGYWLARREFYFGFHARHAAGEARVMRLFRRGAARFLGDHLHEQPRVDGSVGEMPNGAIDHLAYDSVAAYVAKTNHYTDHEARHLFASGRRAGWREILFEPLRHFRHRYWKLGGYKDGVPGLVYCLSTCLYPLLQNLKLWELENNQ